MMSRRLTAGMASRHSQGGETVSTPPPPPPPPGPWTPLNAIGVADGQVYIVGTGITVDDFVVPGQQDISALPDTQLKLMTLVADTAIGSFDLALMCLTELRRRGVLAPADIRRYFDLLPDYVKPDAELAAAE